MKKLLTIFCGLLCFVGLAQDNHALFNEANKAYESEKYRDALALYHQIEADYESAELYFNIGNCYYKIDSIAPAILYLEKSLKLNPTEDASFNLAICNQKITDRIEAEKELVINTWWEKFRSILSTTGWAWLTIILFALASLAWISYQRSSGEAIVKASFSVGVLCTIATVLLLLMTSHVNNVKNNDVEAIIFATNIDIKSSPNETGKTLFVLHQGTKVKIRNRANGWFEIMLADGKTGWIPANEVKTI